MEFFQHKKLLHAHERSQAGTKAWIDIRKCTQVIEFNQEAWL